MNIIAQAIISGLGVGAVYALIGLGVSLLYKSTGIVNLGHGAAVMVVGFALIELPRGVNGGAETLLWGCALGVLYGGVTHVFLVRPYERWAPQHTAVATLVAVFIAAGIIELTVGQQTLALHGITNDVLHIGRITISDQYGVMLMVAAAACLMLYILFAKTMPGKAFLAMASSSTGATLIGVKRNRMLFLSLCLAGALAGLAAALVIPVTGVSAESGIQFAVIALVVCIVGGLDSIIGTILAGLVLGIIGQLSSYYFPAWYNVVQYGMLIIVLRVRPSGFLGGRRI